MIIDISDNIDYFIYKFNISKNDQKRLKNIANFYKEKINIKSFSENNLNKIMYYNGKQSVLDILSYRLFSQKKADKKLLSLIEKFQSKILPKIPITAKILMEKYAMQEGRTLGKKLKIIEEEWVKNNFQISNKQIDRIISR